MWRVDCHAEVRFKFADRQLLSPRVTQLPTSDLNSQVCSMAARIAVTAIMATWSASRFFSSSSGSVSMRGARLRHGGFTSSEDGEALLRQ